MTGLTATWRRWLAGMPQGIIESIWLVAIMRIAISIAGAYVASERTWPHPCHFEEGRLGWSELPYQYKDGLGFKLIGIWERWDACWYAKIAAYGYRPEGDGGFFPFVPALMRVLGAILGGSYVPAGLIISAVALVLALWGLYRSVAPTVGERVARRAMAYVTIFPGALFLLAPFTEPSSSPFRYGRSRPRAAAAGSAPRPSRSARASRGRSGSSSRSRSRGSRTASGASAGDRCRRPSRSSRSWRPRPRSRRSRQWWAP